MLGSKRNTTSKKRDNSKEDAPSKLKVPTEYLKQQNVLSQIVVSLVGDRAAREEIQRNIKQALRDNDVENRRISDNEIRNMILASIQTENPTLTTEEVEVRFERRLIKALSPYVSPSKPVVKKGKTAADEYREIRKQIVKKGRKLRK